MTFVFGVSANGGLELAAGREAREGLGAYGACDLLELPGDHPWRMGWG